MNRINWYIVSELAQLKFPAQLQTKEGTYSRFEKIVTGEIRCRLLEKSGHESILHKFPGEVLYGILLNRKSA